MSGFKKKKCEICGVKTCRMDGQKRIFMARFPLDEDRCKQWVAATGNKNLIHVPIEKLNQLKYICGKHFHTKYFKKKKTQLKKNAVPHIDIAKNPLIDEMFHSFPLHIKHVAKSDTRKDDHNYCSHTDGGPNLQTNIKCQTTNSTNQPLYFVQVTPKIQSIPLHKLENDLDGHSILPLSNQKHGHPVLLIEPLLNTIKVPNILETKIKSEIKPPNIQSDSIIEVQSTETSQIEQNEIHNYIQIKNNTQQVAESVVSSISSKMYNREAIDNIVKTESSENVFDDGKIEKSCRSKQKIKNYVHISDTKVPPRAIAVLPSALQIRGNCILPRRTLSVRVRFGPVQGIRKIITRSEAQMLLSNNSAPVFLLNHNEDYVTHIDVSDKDKSNWMGLLPLGHSSSPTIHTTANLWLYEENDELYAITTESVCARKPLKLGYSKKYVEDHNIPLGPPVLDLETVNPVHWWCNECKRALATASLLQRHTEVYHRDDIRSSRSSYRCRYCKRSFGRLFTLKRHMLTNCLKKPQNSRDIIQQTTNEASQVNEPDISSVLEDNRIPSDESFQNFTNSLDFSTNLFDTDRIAGLDISSNLRDSDLNSYSIGFRDENGLSNDLGFTKLSNTLDNVQNNENNQEQNQPLLETCVYCNQVVVKEKKTKHLRQCPSRLICDCGRVFRHKQSLAQHIHKCHSSTITEKTEKKKPDSNDKDMAYKCQECPIGFKRRGMLVNHLWRVHKTISTIPVEKKVRHYPCIACSKIYRSANKRDRHVRAHHPGAEKLRGQWIEGGVKSCQPASCSECPRQYASRAKLLQHIRHQHPHLAKTMKNQTQKKHNLKTNNQNKDAAEKPPPEEISHFGTIYFIQQNN